MSADIIQFVPRPDPEREARLIRDAQAIYESIFPTEQSYDSKYLHENPKEPA
jgi:hypothetical protein